MDKKSITNAYLPLKEQINANLSRFQNPSEEAIQKELIFCLLTPQSNAKSCWRAVEQLFKEGKWDIPSISNALKSRTRFHNNKAKYVLEALNNWGNIRQIINNDNDIIKLRNNLAENIKGLGLKEASHFLRNIGSSNNQIAILDRHILRNLKALKIINEAKIKSNKHYLEIEQSFLKFSKDIKIPIDHLDLLFWHKEHNEFFK
jgi:N-glycosylase/DNA lyase